jgi:hypothetical protein
LCCGVCVRVCVRVCACTAFFGGDKTSTAADVLDTWKETSKYARESLTHTRTHTRTHTHAHRHKCTRSHTPVIAHASRATHIRQLSVSVCVTSLPLPCVVSPGVTTCFRSRRAC